MKIKGEYSAMQFFVKRLLVFSDANFTFPVIFRYLMHCIFCNTDY